MNKTNKLKIDNVLTVDLEGLSAMLSCGKATARKIGEDAEARIEVGRRVLYSIKKVERYIETMST